MELTGLTPPEWPAVELKGLDTVKLGKLEAILSGTEYDDLDQDELHQVVRAGGEEGPWIAPVRPPLVDALASLGEPRTPSIAADWGATEEFTIGRKGGLSRDEVNELAAALRDLAALARVARDRSEPMYLLLAL